jgi:hypothetical protein
VTGHILNAFYDIYAEDDHNINLIKLGIINMMKMHVDTFKGMIREAYKTGEIDKKANGYLKETLLNLKGFIKYKDDMFIKQGLA